MILRCQDLSKSFGGNKAVDGVNLVVEQSEISSIIGPNGAGKTTLFNLLTGYLPADSGQVWFGGQTNHGVFTPPDQPIGNGAHLSGQ